VGEGITCFGFKQDYKKDKGSIEKKRVEIGNKRG
jgi:hypothetical protein